MTARVTGAQARARIMDAAERLLRDRAFRDLDVSQLMAEAELSRTVFYRHFDGLSGVMLALLSDISDDLRDVLVSEGTAAVIDAAVEAFARHGRFLRAFEQAAGNDAELEAAWAALIERFTAIMTAQLAVAMREGRVVPGDPAQLARALNLMNVHYLLDTFGRDPEFDRDLAAATLTAVWGPVTSGAR